MWSDPAHRKRRCLSESKINVPLPRNRSNLERYCKTHIRSRPFTQQVCSKERFLSHQMFSKLTRCCRSSARNTKFRKNHHRHMHELRLNDPCLSLCTVHLEAFLCVHKGPLGYVSLNRQSSRLKLVICQYPLGARGRLLQYERMWGPRKNSSHSYVVLAV